MKWIDVENYTITASMTVDDINTAENFCRRVPFTEWNGPSCVTSDQAGMVRLERCDIPYCSMFSCASLCHINLCIATACANKKQSLKNFYISTTVADFFHEISSFYTGGIKPCIKFNYNIWFSLKITDI